MTSYSPNLTTTDHTVLIVAPSPDANLLQFGESLASTGASVHFTTDVYNAMARLAMGEPFSHVIVDLVALDAYDRNFLSLAPQYFRDVEFHVPLDNGLSASKLPPGRFEADSCEVIFDKIVGIREAETAELVNEIAEAEAQQHATPEQTKLEEDHEHAAEPTVHPEREEHQGPHGDPFSRALSTDGGSQSGGNGPTMHDIVRERMGGTNGPPARRRPPGAETQQEDARLSQEEMDALLGDPPSKETDNGNDEEASR